MIDIPIRAVAPQATPIAALDLVVDADCMAGTRWRWSHRSVLAQAALPRSLAWSRIVALALAIALHVGMLVRLTIPPPLLPPASTTEVFSALSAAGSPANALRVVFVERTVAVDARNAADDAPVRSLLATTTLEPVHALPTTLTTAPAPAPAVALSAPRIDPPTERSQLLNEAIAADAAPPVSDESVPEARLFRQDGSIALPESVIADLRAVESEQRRFDFVTPGIAGAGSAFTRKPAVAYEPTRFDADWAPVRTLGQDIIVPVAELLTFENKRKTFRCSVLPPVCTWGRTDEGGQLDDPNTLNPVEAAQCRNLWESITAATDQDVWMRLRRQFDAECRKPLLVDQTPPLAPALD